MSCAVERFASLILPTAWVPSAHRAAADHDFRRHLASRLFAPQKSKTNKWCRFQSRKRQEAELRTRIAKHLSGRVRPPGATTLTSDRFKISLRHIRKSAGISDRNHYLSSINPVFNMRITYTKEDMASRVCMTSLPPRCKADR